jgi:BRCA2, oligonucleotide/oligosaccharide-binding, domain 1
MELGRDDAPVAIPVRLRFSFGIYYVNTVLICSYEKELNCGARPALRLIAAQDVSAGLHMILCVSAIVWSGSGIGDDGLPLVPHPTLELTDGWYRLRAQVDEVLAKAARRGVIRVGCKISVSGASVRARFFFTYSVRNRLIFMT